MPRFNLKQTAYHAIKENILSCKYEPGSFLNEDLLCSSLQMSRTPIRDALGRLEQEHFIQIIPRKGFFVSPVSIGEIHMVFEGRLLLEPYIILNYCQDLSSGALDEMRTILAETGSCLSNGDSSQAYKLDRQFHDCIVRQCTNHYFIQLYESLHEQNSRLRVISGNAFVDRLRFTLEEHTDILSKLAEQDAGQAAVCMKRHLQKGKESAIQAFLKASPADCKLPI